MGITITLDLPDSFAAEARAKGLLRPDEIRELLAAELQRRRAGAELQRTLEGVRAQPGEPMSLREIVAEVKTARTERRVREAGY